MYISPKKEFLFIHVPKCAGNAIRKLLEENAVVGDLYAHNTYSNKLTFHGLPGFMKHDDYPEKNWKHVTCLELKEIISDDLWDLCKTRFAVIRNPWARLYSYHSWMKRCYAEGYVHKDVEFNDFVKNCTHNLEPWYIPQYDQICDSSGVMVNCVARMEFLKDDLKDYLDAQNLVSMNSSSSGYDYKDIYTEESKEMVAELYAKDIEFFGFTFESAATKNIGVIS